MSATRALRFMLLLPAFFLAACSSGGYDDSESPPPGDSIAAPDVVGLDQATAESAIVSAGLTIGDVSLEADDTIPAGSVISQDPAANTLLSPGASVDLVVSAGPATIAVPDVVGLPESPASDAITSAGLAVGVVTRQNDNAVPAGNVISQSPAPGTMAGANTAVDLVVSLGPAGSGGFSDEFDADTLAEWSLRHMVEGTPAQYTTLDIDQTAPGMLTIVPTQTDGWFDADDGPLIFKLLDGDFAVHTRVLADSVSNPGQPPGSNFNSAGLMARDPDGATGPENYIMLNVGRQNSTIANGTGSETKTTMDSNSTLILAAGANFGELILCRIGDEFHSFRFLDGDSQWTLTDTFSRPDLPAALQVGMAVSAFNSPADLRAEFDFIRLLPTPAAVDDCTP